MNLRKWEHKRVSACVRVLPLSLSSSFLLFSCFPPCYLFLALFHSCLLHFSSPVPSISISSPFLSLTKATHVWVNPFICITLSLYLSNHLHFSPSIQHLGSHDTPRPSIKTFLWCWFTFGSHVPRSYACCRIIYLQTPQFGLAILNLCRDFLPVYLGINGNEKQPRTYTLPSFSAYVPGECGCVFECVSTCVCLCECACVYLIECECACSCIGTLWSFLDFFRTGQCVYRKSTSKDICNYRDSKEPYFKSPLRFRDILLLFFLVSLADPLNKICKTSFWSCSCSRLKRLQFSKSSVFWTRIRKRERCSCIIYQTYLYLFTYLS